MAKIGHRVPEYERSDLPEARARQLSKIAELRETLIRLGYDSLPKQAAALGVARSTAWHLFHADKASALSVITIKRILACPRLPGAARQVVQEYIEAKLLGAYGHNQSQLKSFRKRMGYPDHPTDPLEERS